MIKNFIYLFLFISLTLIGKSQNLVSVFPSSAQQGQSLSVSISGNNLHFSQATNTLVWFNQGSSTIVYPTGINPVNNNNLNTSFSFPLNQNIGLYNVNVYNEIDGNMTLPNYFSITANPNSPQLVSVFPNSASQGDVLNVSISGQNTHFNQGTGTITWFQQGSSTIIYPNSQNSNSLNNLNASYFIPANASLGYYDTYTSNNTDGLLKLNNSFIINPPVSYIIQSIVVPTNSGSVSGIGNYNNNQSCTLTANNYSGFYFVNWTENGNIVCNTAIYTFNVNSNRILVANFSPVNQFYVNAIVSPLNSGNTTGSGAYNLNQQVTMHALPNNGWYFVNWTENGNVASLDSIYSFNITANRTLVANFNLLIAVNDLEYGNDIDVFPNPVSQFLFIRLLNNLKKEIITLSIYDAVGKLVYNNNLKSDNIFCVNVEDFKKGIYYVKINQNNSKIFTRKIFVNN